MAAWTEDELARVGEAEELELTTERRDGSARRPVTIWVVRVDDDLYVRSARGQAGAWFRAAQATPDGHIGAGGVEKDVAFVVPDDAVAGAVDEAYRTKYARYPSYVEPILTAEVRGTTRKLVPRNARP